VVTSAQAAAFQDICRVLQNRFPAVEVVLAPTLVQGDEAPRQIVAAIERLGRRGDIDVLIVARGGGSLEDLWAFNEEIVVRAVATCPVPVVTGVGHETDTTIVDFAADLRAPTPSAAAAAVVPDREELLGQVAALQQDLRRSVADRLTQQRNALGSCERELALRSPARRIDQCRQQLDDMLAVLRERTLHHIAMKGEQLQSRHTQLKLLDPLRTLDRGFALILDRQGTIVRSTRVLAYDDEVWLRLRDGTVPARITGASGPDPA
jgi:exodeoxyribonuclease VII large subunit